MGTRATAAPSSAPVTPSTRAPTGAPVASPGGNDDTCKYANDNMCDEPNFCSTGTDCTDCGNCGGGTPPATTPAPVTPTTRTPTRTPVAPVTSAPVTPSGSTSCAISLSGCVASVGSECATATQHEVKCRQIKCSGQFGQHCGDQSAVMNVKLTMGGGYKTEYDITADCGTCSLDSSSPTSPSPPAATSTPTRTPTRTPTSATTRSPTSSSRRRRYRL